MNSRNVWLYRMLFHFQGRQGEGGEGLGGVGGGEVFALSVLVFWFFVSFSTRNPLTPASTFPSSPIECGALCDHCLLHTLHASRALPPPCSDHIFFCCSPKPLFFFFFVVVVNSTVIVCIYTGLDWGHEIIQASFFCSISFFCFVFVRNIKSYTQALSLSRGGG